jgi:hypothetical protein
MGEICLPHSNSVSVTLPAAEGDIWEGFQEKIGIFCLQSFKNAAFSLARQIQVRSVSVLDGQGVRLLGAEQEAEADGFSTFQQARSGV